MDRLSFEPHLPKYSLEAAHESISPFGGGKNGL